MSHTPGPWSLDAERGALWNVIDSAGNDVALAQQRVGGGVPDHERAANAKLIAQAPLLPEAIEALRGTVAALGWLVEDERYSLAVGDNPYAVTEMLAATSKALSEARAILQRYEEASR